MQRKEANFGSICKSLNVKKKKARVSGLWKGREGGDRQKGGEEETKTCLLLSSLCLFPPYQSFLLHVYKPSIPLNLKQFKE